MGGEKIQKSKVWINLSGLSVTSLDYRLQDAISITPSKHKDGQGHSTMCAARGVSGTDAGLIREQGIREPSGFLIEVQIYYIRHACIHSRRQLLFCKLFILSSTVNTKVQICTMIKNAE